MDSSTFFFEEVHCIPYVSFVISRTDFTRWREKERTIEDHELVMITDGSGVLRLRDAVLPCSRGTLLYLHYKQRYSLEADEGKNLNFYAVHFSYLLSEHFHESWSYHKELKYYLKDKQQEGKNWSFSDNPGLLPFESTMQVSNYAKIEDIFIQLNDTFLKRDVGCSMKLSILCQQLIYEVCCEHFFPAAKKANVRRLDQAIAYIEQNYKKPIDLQTLSSYISVSKSYLFRLFRNNLGKTPVEYINQVRVNQAKGLLLRTEMSIKEIAYEVGFCDEFYFSRVFKKLEGVSPRKYRNIVLS